MIIGGRLKSLTGRSEAPVRVVIADDEIAVRRALKRVFERHKQIELVGEAADGREALEVVVATTPDVVVLDLAMGDHDGMDAISAIRSSAPETKIVVLSSMARFYGSGTRAAELGAHRVLDKFTPPRRLVKAILDAVKGAD